MSACRSGVYAHISGCWRVVGRGAGCRDTESASRGPRYGSRLATRVGSNDAAEAGPSWRAFSGCCGQAVDVAPRTVGFAEWLSSSPIWLRVRDPNGAMPSGGSVVVRGRWTDTTRGPPPFPECVGPTRGRPRRGHGSVPDRAPGPCRIRDRTGALSVIDPGELASVRGSGFSFPGSWRPCAGRGSRSGGVGRSCEGRGSRRPAAWGVGCPCPNRGPLRRCGLPIGWAHECRGTASRHREDA